MVKNVFSSVCLTLAVMGLSPGQEFDALPTDDAVVLGEEDLAERGEILRNLYRRITPPCLEMLVQNIGAMPAAWEEFTGPWDNATAVRELGAWVVPVMLSQAEGTTVVSGANGRVLCRETNDFARLDSSGVVLTGTLVAEADWPVYEAVRETVAGLEASSRHGERAQIPGRHASPTNGLRFSASSTDTNGAICLSLAWEQDGNVDIFVYSGAHTSSWVVATWTNDENSVVTDTNLVWTAIGSPFAGMESAWKWRGATVITDGIGEFVDADFPESEGRLRFYAAAVAVDTDDDGLNDGWEMFVSHTDPCNSDTDGDGISDGNEVCKTESDPNNSDTDGDGLPDGWEVQNGLSPLSATGNDGGDADPDGDGFSNALEYELGGAAQNEAWSASQLAYRLLHLQNGGNELGLRVEIEDALNCGGANDARQNVVATLEVPDLMDWGVFLDVTVQGKVEDQNQNYDWVTIEAYTNTFFFGGNENHNGCTMAEKSVTCRVLVLPNSQVKLRYDTKGHKFHLGAYAAITGVSVAGAIKSQTLSAHPPKEWRTELGVGEEFALISPWFLGEAVWHQNGEATPVGTGPLVIFTAPDEGGALQLSVSFNGHVVSRTFQVLEPEGIASAQIQATDSFAAGCCAAGMILYPVVVGSTHVSFYKVQIKEVGREATNCTGWWATHAPQPHNAETGAGIWIPLNENNFWQDHVVGNLSVQEGAAGHFEWEIPALWKVMESETEHVMTGWLQEFDLESTGTVTIRKFGKWVTRTLDGTTSHN